MIKLIDNRGKVLGIINIIDLGVIITLLVSVCVFFNLARNAKLGYPSEVDIKVLFPSVAPDIIKKINPGDKNIGRTNRIKLLRYEKKGNNRDGFADIYAWMKLDLRIKDVLIGNKGEKTSKYFSNGEELNIYDPINFESQAYSIRGKILNIGLIDREIEVILEPYFPAEVINMIEIGDRVIRWGHITGEVIEKENYKGKVKVTLHILRGEVDLKPGQQFPFETEKYYVYGNIIKSIPWQSD